MKKIGMLLGMVIMFSLAISSCATTNPLNLVPLPQDVQIIPPDQNLPPKVKAFSGKWGSRWWMIGCPSDHGLDSVLIVEKVERERAIVVYCWGNSPEWNITNGQRRFTAKIYQKKEGQFILSFFSAYGKKFEFYLKGDKLEGIIIGTDTFITMKRLP